MGRILLPATVVAHHWFFLGDQWPFVMVGGGWFLQGCGLLCYLLSRGLKRDPILCSTPSPGDSYPPFSHATFGRHRALNQGKGSPELVSEHRESVCLDCDIQLGGGQQSVTHTTMPGLRENLLCQLLPETLLNRLSPHNNSNYNKVSPPKVFCK